MIYLIRLTRPLNCVLAALTSLLGSFLSTHVLTNPHSWIGALTVGLVTAGGNVMNDLCDLPADRINHPSRALVSAKVSRAWAMGLLSFTWGAAAFLSALVLDSTSADVVAIVLLLLILYNFSLKGLPFIGNLTVAGVAWLVLRFGAITAAHSSQVIYPVLLELGAISAALLHLSREMVKSAQDMEGDKAQKRTTLPILVGLRRSLLFALIPIAAVPFVARVLLTSEAYCSTFVLSVSILTLLLLWSGLRAALKPESSTISRFSRALKITMAVGLLLLLVADLAWS